MDTKKTNKDSKVQVNLLLDQDDFEWIQSEAKSNAMTINEVIESLISTMRCMTDSKDSMMSGIMGMFDEGNDDGILN